MKRHAYLITAYDNFYVLERLLHLLDDPRNDLYVHIDKKARGFDQGSMSTVCRYSEVIFLPRIKVYWGDYSQVRSILRLLRSAAPQAYSYYHLLSGSDLPLKSQDHIHRFFLRHEGTEFVHLSAEYPRDWVERIHTQNRFVSLEVPILRRVVPYARKAMRLVIMWLRRNGVGRLTPEIKYGSDWWSITHNLATRVVNSEAEIERLFKYALVPTEFYVQTVAWNSPLRAHISSPDLGNMRYIDWARRSSDGAHPYVFKDSDYGDLLASPWLFARKFDADVDKDVVDRICAHLTEEPPRKPGVHQDGANRGRLK